MSMTHEEAARILDPDTTREALNPYADSPVDRMRALDEACRIAAAELRNRKTGEALTLEQLRKMDGQPVYCADRKEWGIIHIDPDGPWANVPFFRGVYCDLDVQRNGLSLYAYPPAHIDREAWKPCLICNAQKMIINSGYCPHCGRPLTEEAWAELEKRMGVRA